jgi:hypothetical protein
MKGPASEARGAIIPRARRTILYALAAASVAAASCSAQGVSSFSWKDGSGAPMEFREASPWPAGSEGSFQGARRKNRYVLEKGLELPAGSSLVISLRRLPGGSGPVHLDLAPSSRPDGASPLGDWDFPLLSDRSSIFLDLGTASRIASLSASIQGESGGFVIESIAVAPAFRGYDAEVESVRVSSGFSMALSGGERRLSIAKPFLGLDAHRAGILIEYGASPPGAAIAIKSRDGGGSRDYLLRTQPKGGRTVLDLGLLGADSSLVELVAPEGLEIKSFYATSLGEADYQLADLGRVLSSGLPVESYALYRWDLLPEVLIFDFKDYATQALYLSRLAFFVEKIGYRGTLVSDEVVASQHGWNAHDYRPEDLAAFFEAARERSFHLSAQETELEALLVREGLLKESGGRVAAGKGAIISISRESSAALRWTLAVHESTHALFFSDASYRSFARGLWSSLGPGEKWFWKAYLAWAGYDAASDYLMGNEFQAYLLQQPVSAAREYFQGRKAAELLDKHPELKDRVEGYMSEFGDSFAQRASSLQSWLYPRYGIEAGRTVFLSAR